MLNVILATIRFLVRLLDRLTEKHLDAADADRANAASLTTRAAAAEKQASVASRLADKLEGLLK